MQKILLVLAVLVVHPLAVSAQTNVQIGASNVRASTDFATRAFQDPWDMNEWTDLGRFLDGVDTPRPNLSGISFAGGVFSGTSTNNDPSVFLLDTGNPHAARLGKTGSNHPIDANTYKLMALRMSVSSTNAQMQFFWNAGTIFDNPSTLTAGTPNFLLTPGFRIYLFDMSALPTTALGAAGFSWGGTVGALRLDPTNQSGDHVQIDWARLVAADASLCRTITWDGPTSVDIYLDTDTNPANGTLGAIALGASRTAGAAASASAGCSTSGAGYKYYAGALAPGTYRVLAVSAGVSPSSATAANYSSGTWVVNDIPTLRFTSPSPEGSSDDFATTVLGNPWDMDALSDIDFTHGLVGPHITTMNLQTPGGVGLGSQRVLRATSTEALPGSVGDPYLSALFWVTGRGATHRIDTNRYRLLTFEFGIPDSPRHVNEGSIARIVWKVAGLEQESVSDDIIFTHRSGANVLDSFTVDMADRAVLPIEEGAFTGQQGWINGTSANPGLDIFRVDPHEFSDPTDFYIRRIKLAAFERTDRLYAINWAYSDSGGSGTVDLYYDSDGSGFNGTLIQANLPTTGSGSYTWDTSGVTLPRAYIYAVFRDSFIGGANENRAYAKWPIVLTANAPPAVSLNRSSLRFGAAHTGTSFAAQTGPQAVRITQSGSGSPSFTASSNQPWLVVSPASGGTPATLTVSVQHHGSVPISGTANGTITLTFAGAEPASATVAVTLATTPNGTTAAPVGNFDTPADGLNGITGSIALTGWALDDLDVAQVRILRSHHQGLCATWDPASLVPIGTATFVDGARPDVAAGHPTLPRNTRAGWGYMMLSNFLPNLGNGTFTFCAMADDVEGRSTLLGTKTLSFDNANAVKPFGAIDTPGQGATASGNSYHNFGWVLARTPGRADPPSGGTVTVFIDAAPVGTPTGWTSRSDLTALFPAATYPGVVNAAGVYTFNPGSLADGLHTIAWSVTDHLGNTDGVGSRYFTVAGGAGGSVSNASAAAVTLAAPPMLPAPSPAAAAPSTLAAAVNAAGLTTTPVRGRRGFDLTAPFRAIATRDGRSTVHGEELDRFEIRLGGGHGQLTGYMRIGDTLGPLPIGSHLDEAAGTFGWQPGVGFVGAYDLVFVRWADGQAVSRQEARFVLHPQGSNRVGPQVTIDMPAAHQHVGSRFRVAGWALDQDDAIDTGVTTVHVWAYPIDPLTGARLDPSFLGVAFYGGARPDVGAVFGERYTRSGFDLAVDRVLAPGTYDVAVFAWSTARGGFAPARVVRMTVSPLP